MNKKSKPVASEGLAATRIRLGFSQQQFADELGVAKSVIAMAEINRRPLPTALLLKIAALETCLANQSGKTALMPKHPGEADDWSECNWMIAKMRYRSARCLDQAALLQNKLTAMENRYHETRNALQLIEEQLSIKDKNKLNTNLQHVQDRLVQQLQSCGQPAQALLSIRIALLEAEATTNNELEQQLTTKFPELFSHTKNK